MDCFKSPQDEVVKGHRHPSPECHCKLRTISSIPGVSTIYFCPACSAYWELDAQRGWDLLIDEESPRLALSS